jgi:hypothetical protein
MQRVEKTRDGLLAPRSYIIVNQKVRDLTCNGCGPKMIEFLVPEKLWGVDIEKACDIHDWMYSEGEDESDRNFADDVFHKNMLLLIYAHPCSRVLRRMRLRAARLYYNAVRGLGSIFFKSRVKRMFKRIWNWI